MNPSQALFVSASLVAMMLTASSSFASGPRERIRFTWNRGAGADSCPSQEEVERAIEKGLGPDRFSPTAARAIDVTITRKGGSWRAVVDDYTGSEHLEPREFTSIGERCDTVTNTVVGVLTLRLASASSVEESAEPEKDPPVSAKKQSASIPETIMTKTRPTKEAQTEKNKASSLAWTFTFRSAARAGILPQVAPDLGFFAAAGAKSLEASAGISWTTSVPTDDGRAAFALNTFWLGGCVHPIRRERVTLSGCSHVLAGAVTGSLLALDELTPRDLSEKLWVAVAFSPRARLPIWRFSASKVQVVVEFGADVTASLYRQSFLVREDSASRRVAAQYDLGSVAGGGFFGLGMSIP